MLLRNSVRALTRLSHSRQCLSSMIKVESSNQNKDTVSMTIFQHGYRVDNHFLTGLSKERGIKTEVDEFYPLTTGFKMELPKGLIYNRDFRGWLRMVRYQGELERIHKLDQDYIDYEFFFDEEGNFKINQLKNDDPYRKSLT